MGEGRETSEIIIYLYWILYVELLENYFILNNYFHISIINCLKFLLKKISVISGISGIRAVINEILFVISAKSELCNGKPSFLLAVHTRKRTRIAISDFGFFPVTFPLNINGFWWKVLSPQKSRGRFSIGVWPEDMSSVILQSSLLFAGLHLRTTHWKRKKTVLKSNWTFAQYSGNSST